MCLANYNIAAKYIRNHEITPIFTRFLCQSRVISWFFSLHLNIVGYFMNPYDGIIFGFRLYRSRVRICLHFTQAALLRLSPSHLQHVPDNRISARSGVRKIALHHDLGVQWRLVLDVHARHCSTAAC